MEVAETVKVDPEIPETYAQLFEISDDCGYLHRAAVSMRKHQLASVVIQRLPESVSSEDLDCAVVQVNRPNPLRGFGTLYQHAVAMRFDRGLGCPNPALFKVDVWPTQPGVKQEVPERKQSMVFLFRDRQCFPDCGNLWGMISRSIARGGGASIMGL